MDALDIALHGLNFIAPAWFLALGVVWGARLWPRAGLGLAKGSWPRQVLLHGIVGTGVLGVGLWFFGVDGKMATYGALAMVASVLQWLLARGWRR